jgi:hypothetical protein
VQTLCNRSAATLAVERFYEAFVPLADKIYDQHLKELGENNDTSIHGIRRKNEP